MVCANRESASNRARRLSNSFAYVVVVLAVLFAGATDATPGNGAPFNAELDSIIKRELPSGHSISIQVADLETGRVLMEKEPDLPLAPASTMKVVTAAAALNVLNPEFTFLTEVWAEGVRGSSVGNIFLKGYGDPYLVSEELFALTRSLAGKGIARGPRERHLRRLVLSPRQTAR